MKKTLLTISILTAGFLFAPAFCLGAVNYERTPAGYTIQNPTTIQVSFDNLYSDFNCNPVLPYWGLGFNGTPDFAYSTGTYLASTTTGVFIENLPIGEFYSVRIYCCPTEIIGAGVGCQSASPALEINGTDIIFEVVAGGLASIFTIPANAVASVSDYIGDLFDTFGPFIWLFIGVPLAFVVMYRIKKIVPK